MIRDRVSVTSAVLTHLMIRDRVSVTYAVLTHLMIRDRVSKCYICSTHPPNDYPFTGWPLVGNPGGRPMTFARFTD